MLQVLRIHRDISRRLYMYTLYMTESLWIRCSMRKFFRIHHDINRMLYVHVHEHVFHDGVIVDTLSNAKGTSDTSRYS